MGQRSDLDVDLEPDKDGSSEEDDAGNTVDENDESDEHETSVRREEASSEDESSEEDVPIVPKKKGPAWTDPDDPALEVSLAGDKRRRKLRDAISEDVVGGREYERRLRRQFEKINPTPDWASAARKKLHPSKTKRRRPSTSGSESDEEDVLPDVLADAKGILREGRKASTLPQGRLDIERLRDANLAARSEGEVKTVQFHPSPEVPVLMVASTDRRLRLFNVRFLSRLSLLTAYTVFLDQWTHKSTSADRPYTGTPHHECHVPSWRIFYPAHRASPFLLHIRPHVWHCSALAPRFMGDDLHQK